MWAKFSTAMLITQAEHSMKTRANLQTLTSRLDYAPIIRMAMRSVFPILDFQFFSQQQHMCQKCIVFCKLPFSLQCWPLWQLCSWLGSWFCIVIRQLTIGCVVLTRWLSHCICQICLIVLIHQIRRQRRARLLLSWPSQIVHCVSHVNPERKVKHSPHGLNWMDI